MKMYVVYNCAKFVLYWMCIDIQLAFCSMMIAFFYRPKDQLVPFSVNSIQI